MPNHAISSSEGVAPQRRRGRPRTHATDAARKLAWYHRQRQTGEATMSDVPPVVHEELYCNKCCMRRSVRMERKQYHCSSCGTALELPRCLFHKFIAS